MTLEDGDLRGVRAGAVEVVRRLSMAVRDTDWVTIAPQPRAFDVQQDDDGFRVAFRSRHVGSGIDLSWDATITGSPGGELVYEMDATLATSCAYNRIGLVVLHPAGFAGAPVVLGTDDGELTETLPRLIEPQWEHDGVLQGLFRPFTSLRVDLPGGIAVGHTFTGELFEMEDQRNWGDGSFKTYSTPQAWGIPHRAEAGTRFLQRVVVRVAGADRAPAAPDPAAPVALHVGAATGRRLPAIGLGAGTATVPADAVAAAAPDHLRVELGAGEDRLAAAAALAAELGCGLEIGLHVDADGGGPDLPPQPVPVVRAVVVPHGGVATGDAVDAAGRRVCVPVFGDGGTAFADLNRARPHTGPMAGLAFSLSPQHHLTDDRVLFENLEAQAVMVATAAAISGGKPVVVSPVTLGAGGRPDARQATPLAAAWTLGSIAALAEGGAASVTCSTVDDLLDGGSPAPALRVFADLAGWRDADVAAATSADPLRAAVLALRRGRRLRVLVACLSPDPVTVRVGPLPGARATVTGDGGAVALEGGHPTLALQPYEVARIDAAG